MKFADDLKRSVNFGRNGLRFHVSLSFQLSSSFYKLRSDMPDKAGGCLCGANRYAVSTNPVRVTFCHCRFCQRATGSAYLVEPIFDRDSLRMLTGSPSTYEHRSEGSGKLVTINFCATCGTKLFLEFERFSGVVGVYGGTFDDPNWFQRTPENSKHIFLSVAQNGTVIPPGFDTFQQHAILTDGGPVNAKVFDAPYIVKSRHE